MRKTCMSLNLTFLASLLSSRLLTVCVLIGIHSFYNAFQLWRRWVVRKDRHACGVAAELLAALEFSGGEDAGKHACQDGKGGWAACKKHGSIFHYEML